MFTVIEDPPTPGDEGLSCVAFPPILPTPPPPPPANELLALAYALGLLPPPP
jgi:hypothetical protein